MKIYNEIIIDMNPESSSYGETLHEDSFEYHGQMMLMQSSILGQGDTDKAQQLAARLGSRYGIFNGEYWYYQEGSGWIKPNTSDPAFTVDYYKEGDSEHTRVEQFTYDISTMEGDSSKWAATFAPTSDEFRASVERTGGYEEMFKLYGLDPKDYDEYKDYGLDYIQQQYGVGGTEQRTASAAYKESKEDYTTGQQALGLQTGQNLASIYSQTEEQMASSGMEYSGGVAFKGKQAEKGVFSEYLLQQKGLAKAKRKAKTAWDIGETGRRDTLGFNIEEFWDTAETGFATDVEEGLDSD